MGSMPDPLVAQDGERSFTISLRPTLPAEPAAIRDWSPLLLVGEGTAEVAHDLLAALLLRGQRVVVADGANRFDAYRLARAARAAGRPAGELLAAVRVSRAFTWQQFAALLERGVGAVAAAWVLALGPLDLLADGEVKPWQADGGARRVAEALAGMGRKGLGIIAAQEERVLRMGGRESLLGPLARACPHHVAVNRTVAERAGIDGLPRTARRPALMTPRCGPASPSPASSVAGVRPRQPATAETRAAFGGPRAARLPPSRAGARRDVGSAGQLRFSPPIPSRPAGARGV